MNRNAAQIPGFTESLCCCNDAQHGQERPESHHCKPSSKDPEIVGIEWAAAGFYMSCLARAEQSTMHNVVEY